MTPEPSSPLPSLPAETAAAGVPPWWQRSLTRLLQGVRCGSLCLMLPGGQALRAQGALPGPTATLVLTRWRALLRLATQGDLGLAEAYRDGDWSSPDLAALLEFGARNEPHWGGALAGRGPARWIARQLHRRRANTRRGSRRNIAFHYDLGNDFYAEWLDTSMLYSSALFERGDETLEQAQALRLERIVQLVAAPPGGSVLEIGCGWGALAVALARSRAARVTGITLSQQQLAHARERAARHGVQHDVELRLQDYRDLTGRYDRIVSIEMIEAVGEDYWPDYFATLRRCLAPGGHVVLQAITIADEHFAGYRRGADFIQRHVFPGGMLPAPAVLRAQAERAGFTLREQLLFGPSYAATLAEWRRRFLAAWPRIERQGFDADFRRLWEYYLCYCEAGFRTGRVDVGLYTLVPRDG